MSEEADQLVEADIPSPETGVDQPAEADIDGADLELDPDAPDTQEEDDTEEVEREGKKYRIPKALAPELLMQADYTRKTQDLAQQRTAVEALQAEAAKRVEVQQAFIGEFAEVTALQKQIAEYEKITDWNALRLEHGDAAVNDAQFAYGQLKAKLQGAEQTLFGKIQQRDQEQQRATAKQFADRDAELQRDIPGWSPELRGKLEERALKAGFSKTDIDTSDARAFKLLHRLTFLEAKYAQDKKASSVTAAAQSQPAQTVRGAAPAVKDPERMTTAEWMDYERKRLAKNPRRA